MSRWEGISMSARCGPEIAPTTARGEAEGRTLLNQSNKSCTDSRTNISFRSMVSRSRTLDRTDAAGEAERERDEPCGGRCCGPNPRRAGGGWRRLAANPAGHRDFSAPPPRWRPATHPPHRLHCVFGYEQTAAAWGCDRPATQANWRLVCSSRWGILLRHRLACTMKAMCAKFFVWKIPDKSESLIFEYAHIFHDFLTS